MLYEVITRPMQPYKIIENIIKGADILNPIMKLSFIVSDKNVTKSSTGSGMPGLNKS